MPFNGAGQFNRIYNWQNDAANNLDILAPRMDQEMDGFASGLSNCLTRDGQGVPSAPINWGGQNLYGVNVLTAAALTLTGNEAIGGDLTVDDINASGNLSASGNATVTGSVSSIGGFFRDGNFYMSLGGGGDPANPIINVDAQDYWFYDRAANIHQFGIANTNKLSIAAGSITGAVNILRGGSNSGGDFGLGLNGANAMIMLQGTNVGMYYDQATARAKIKVGNIDVFSIDNNGDIRILGNLRGAQAGV